MVFLQDSDTFVAFSLPGQTDHEILIHDSNADSDIIFKMEPFDGNLPIIEITSKKYSTNTEFSFASLHTKRNEEEINKSDYISGINNAKELIEQGILEKVVISRKIFFQYRIDDVFELFNHYKRDFPQQFVYVIHSPSSGTWLGASPEQLIEKTPDYVKTVALAGTLKKSKRAVSRWTQKELDEQGIIRKYFEEIFIKNNLTFSTDETYTASAGSIVHLKNNYLLPADTDVNALISAIHPSPAICGTPLESAKQAIRDLEPHNREYYCGYLGKFSKTSVNLFVNIRCMKVWSTGVELFVGGGITRDSNPEKEWEETELKAKVLTESLDKLRSQKVL